MCLHWQKTDAFEIRQALSANLQQTAQYQRSPDPEDDSDHPNTLIML